MGKKFLVTAIFIMIIYGITCNGIYYGQSIEPLQGYFNINDNMVVEKGERITFKVNKVTDEELVDMIKEAFNNIDEKLTLKTSKENSFEFISKNINGYIEKDRNNVIIYVKTENNKISISQLEDEICKLVQGKGYDLQTNPYLIIKSENDANKAKENLLSLLKNKGAENIKELALEKKNRISISANSHSFSSTKILGVDVDVNIAVVNYNTGCYIIIGTPIIPITY